MLTAKEICDRYKISSNTLYRFVKSGVIPQPIKIGRASRWRERSIEEAFAERDVQGRAA